MISGAKFRQSSRLKLGAGALLAISSFFVMGLASVVAEELRCVRAQHAAGLEKSFPALHDKVVAGEPIRIVALGSSSTEGTPDMPRSQIYASVLERTLARETMTPVELVNKGKGGETIPLMVARLERDVISLRPDLLVWQLGVNDVLAMDDVSGAIREMRRALSILKARNVPVVLVDLQVSPLVDRDRDTPIMQNAIAEAAQVEGVMHFHRYDVMKTLVVNQDATLQELVMGDGLHMTRLGHLCTGSLLAKQIAKASLIRKLATSASLER